jgi:hypothetical protein
MSGLVAEQARAPLVIRGGDRLGWHVDDLRLDPGGGRQACA